MLSPEFYLHDPRLGKFLHFKNPRVSIKTSDMNKNSDFLLILKDLKKENPEKYLVGYLGYSFSGELEKKVEDLRPEILPLPKALFALFDKPEILDVKDLISRCKTQNIQANISIKNLIPDLEYINMIERAREHMKAGDIYVVNLSRPFLLQSEKIINSFEFFVNAHKKNPAPYSSYVKFDDDLSFCSLSPECFLHKEKNILSTFPIKGTAEQVSQSMSDANIIECLLNDPKEFSENLMIVDLERNDLGKLALPSTVKVEEFCKPHSFGYVHHLISKISCQLDVYTDIFDALTATFPSGSVTGTPKVRAMQIIKELEPFPRGIYTGCIGLISPDGDALFSMLIRTACFDNRKEISIVNTGGGIVLNSDARKENEETYTKLNALSCRS